MEDQMVIVPAWFTRFEVSHMVGLNVLNGVSVTGTPFGTFRGQRPEWSCSCAPL